MNLFTEQVLDYGILATYNYIKYLCMYYRAFDNPKSKEHIRVLLKKLSCETKSSFSDCNFIENYSKKEIADLIVQTAMAIDDYDELFAILFSNIEQNLGDLIKTQEIKISNNLQYLTARITKGAIINIKYKHIYINGFATFIYIAKKVKTVDTEKLLNLCGHLLLQPYIDETKFQEYGFTDDMQFYTVTNVTTNQLLIFETYKKSICNPTCFLSLNNEVAVFYDSIFETKLRDMKIDGGIISEFLLIDTDVLENAMTVYINGFNYVWMENPQEFFINILNQLSKADIFSESSLLPGVYKGSVRTFLVNIFHYLMSDIMLTEPQNMYIHSCVSGAYEDFLRYYLKFDEKSQMRLFYILNTIYTLKSLAVDYLTHKNKCSVEALNSLQTNDYLSLYDFNERIFKERPTVEELSNLILYIDSLQPHQYDQKIFELYMSIQECIVFNLAYWFELTKYLTGYKEHKLIKVFQNGTYILQIIFTNNLFVLVKGNFQNEIINFDNDFIIDSRSTFKDKQILNILLPGTLTFANILEYEYKSHYTVNTTDLFFSVDTENLCIYPFNSNDDIVPIIYNIPYYMKQTNIPKDNKYTIYQKRSTSFTNYF